MPLSSAGSPANGAGLCLIFFATQLRGCFNNGADYEHFALETPMVCGPAVGDGRHGRPDPDNRRCRLVSAYGLRGFYVPGPGLVRVSRFSPPSPAPAPPDFEKPRLVVSYRGMQVLDAREHVLVVIEGEQPCGLGAGLRAEGFRRRSSNTWEAPANPQNYMAARVIGRTFFQSDEQ